MSSLPDYADALTAALRAAEGIVLAVEEVILDSAAGRGLAREVIADRDLPPFDRAQMDGYALRAADVAHGKAFVVAGTIHAGQEPAVTVPAGSCAAIATGAALPNGTDAVIQLEQCDEGRNAKGPVTFAVPAVTAGHAVHARGADARAGAVVLRAGTLLQSHHLGIAASVGAARLAVRVQPRVTILTSGDEVVEVTRAPQPWQIRNSNAVMLRGIVGRFGGRVVNVVHIEDAFDATLRAVHQAAQSSDLVITVGGVSAGELDHFPAAFEKLDVRFALQGAAIQPGRPVVVGRVPGGALIVGLPGNPVSALACAHLFVWPILRAMMGLREPLPWRTIELGEEVKPNPQRRAFRAAIIREDGRGIVPSWAGSGDLVHTAPTHGLVELPVQSQAVAPGGQLRFLPWA